MKEIQVVALDDVHRLEGQRVEADEIDVPLKFGDQECELDLTGSHYQAVKAFLAPFFEAAAAADDGRAKGAAKKKFVSPLDQLCPFPASTHERRDYLTGIRLWADRVDRQDEYMPKGNSTGEGFHYPKQLLLDYNEYLASQVKKRTS